MDSEKQQQSNPQDTSRKNPQTDDTRDQQRQGSVQPDQKDRKSGQGQDDHQDKSKKTA
jgi:hypothetical protein